MQEKNTLSLGQTARNRASSQFNFIFDGENVFEWMQKSSLFWKIIEDFEDIGEENGFL